MKTFIGQYNLVERPKVLWGLKGYEQVMILVRRGLRPLRILRFRKNQAAGALAGRDIEQALYPLLDIPATDPGQPIQTGLPEIDVLPFISVIVCTRDRPHSLARCLSALQSLDYPHYEVIIVDNASQTSETAELVTATPFRYVREGRPGLNWARNRGLVEARAEIVAYVDDDAQVDRGWLKGLAAGFAASDVVAVTGLVLPAELETRAQHLFEMYGNGMSKGLVYRIFDPVSASAVEIIRAQDIGVGTNMAFRRNALGRLGGFDTALEVGTPACGAGDLDILHRVLMGGGAIRYEPRALVWHRHRRDMIGLRQQFYNNGRSYGVYLIKRWHERRIGRAILLHFAIWTWGRWLVGRILLRLLRRHRLPLQLLWAELRGALSAPWAAIATRRYDERIREKFSNVHNPGQGPAAV